MARVLAVENNGQIQSLIERRINSGITLCSVSSLESARESLKHDRFDIIILNTRQNAPEPAGLVPFLVDISDQCPQTRILVMSEFDEPPHPDLNGLSYEWIRRPLGDAQLWARIDAAVETSAEAVKPPEARGLVIPTEFEGMLVASLPMQSVVQQILEAAAENIPVLISGETGTGKDLVAAAIHRRSKRKAKRFLPVNMGAIASELIASELFGHEKGAYTGASQSQAGFFEQADGGTIFLDEITTMDEKVQISLLRVLETKTIRRVRGERDIKVDVRVIAATNENIEELVRTRRFREDLFYRLDVFRIHLPPVRERPGAVSLLTDHFVGLFGAMYNKQIRVVSPETYRLLKRYPWPGNVRELKNVVQRAVLLTKTAEFTPAVLPSRILEMQESSATSRPGYSPIQVGMTLSEVEKELIKMTLAAVSGNKVKAAAILGISRRALYDKLKRFGLL
jgi:DNA-binding NtrC family response regulator